MQELGVPNPGPRLVEGLKGADVDEGWIDAVELDVVRRSVLEDEAVFDATDQQIELRECCRFQHGKRPLVGVRDHRDALVAHESGPVAGGHVHRGPIHQFGADHLTRIEEFLKELHLG